MTSQHDKPKRWRPQFSLRAMLGVFVIVAAFCCGWKAHEQWLATRPMPIPAHRIGPLYRESPSFRILKSGYKVDGEWVYDVEPETKE